MISREFSIDQNLSIKLSIYLSFKVWGFQNSKGPPKFVPEVKKSNETPIHATNRVETKSTLYVTKSYHGFRIQVSKTEQHPHWLNRHTIQNIWQRKQDIRYGRAKSQCLPHINMRYNMIEILQKVANFSLALDFKSIDSTAGVTRTHSNLAQDASLGYDILKRYLKYNNKIL